MVEVILDTKDIIQIIIAGIALYGATISTYTLYSRRPRVKVKTTTSFIGEPGVGIVSPLLLTITAMNRGEKPVMLGYVGLNLPHKSLFQALAKKQDQMKLQFPHPDEVGRKLPHSLIPGSSFDYSLPFINIANSLKKSGYSGVINVTAYFSDQIGNTFKTKKFSFDIDRWLNGT